MRLATYSRTLVVLILTLFAGTFSSCRKTDDIRKAARVYFTYTVGYNSSVQQTDGSIREACISGDGMCAFEVREPGWRPAGKLADGQGFGYMTVTSGMKLRMVIYMPFLSTNTYREHYADGVASIPGSWKVALQLLTGVGLSDGYSISKGDYSIGLGVEDGYEVLIVTYG